MKTIDNWFSESIRQYVRFCQETSELNENLGSLSLSEILQKCESIKKTQHNIAEQDRKLHEVISFIGEDVLENSQIGEYQRALDKAIRETEQIAGKLRLRRTFLTRKQANVSNPSNRILGYVEEELKESDSLIQRKI